MDGSRPRQSLDIYGHGQNFVQKDWVNGLSSHAPDEERIGITIIFCHINKCGSTEEEKMLPL